MHRLTEGGVLSEVSGEAPGLLPARPPETITVADVLHVVRTHNGVCGDSTGPAGAHESIQTALGEFYAAGRASPANLAFSELVDRVDSASR